jgi:DNA-binding transcriptional regulator/RsmH inhibitor MraZ
MATVDYFERKLDDKRRLTIPPELRDKFASGAVLPEVSASTSIFTQKMSGITWSSLD